MKAPFRSPILAAALAVAMGLAAGPAVGQVDGLGFDMDGNIGNADANTSNSNGNNIGSDWQEIAEGTISPGDVRMSADGRKCTLVNGSINTEVGDMTVAWKGATKDFNDLPEWWQKDFSASSKSDLINFAIAVWKCDHDKNAATEDHLIVNYATDRLSTNGTTFVGVWFGQGEIAFNGQRFSGTRTVGDVLTVVDFRGSIQPGDVVNQTIGVYEWNGGPGADLKDTIDIVVSPVLGNGGCRDGASTTALIGCSIVNDVQEDAAFGSWNFTSGDSGSPTGKHTAGSFVEGSVDLTEATLDPDLCVATTQFETRQSDSISAILDDIGLAAAPSCGMNVTLACQNLGPDFNNNVFDYRISGTVATTAGTVDNIVINKLMPAPTEVADGDVDGVNTTGVAWGPFDFSLPVNGGFDAKVNAIDPSGLYTPATSVPVACPSVMAGGALSILKDCVACMVDNGNDLGVRIRAAGSVTNTDDDVPIVSFDINEISAGTNDFSLPHTIASFPGDFTSGSADFPDPNGNGKLDPGESVFYSLEYTPNDLPGTDDDIAHAHDLMAFEDMVDLANIVAQFNFPVDDPSAAMGQCELCAPGMPGFGLNCAPATP